MVRYARSLTRRRLVGGAAGTAAATWLARPTARIAAQDAEETVRVGIITSQSGPLQSYGEQYLKGLEVGLDYLSDGTGVVEGRKIEFTIVDDTGAPDVAVNAAKDLIG